MKNLKRVSIIAILSLLTLGTVNTVFGQGQRPPRGQGQVERPQIDSKKIVQEQLEWFKKNFELSEDQLSTIEEIHNSDAENKKVIMESGLSPRDTEFREKMEGIDITKEAKIQKVLTEEQWSLFESKKEEYSKIGRQERPERRGRNG